jgi:hypothetical protein
MKMFHAVMSPVVESVVKVPSRDVPPDMVTSCRYQRTDVAPAFVAPKARAVAMAIDERRKGNVFIVSPSWIVLIETFA